MADKLEKSIKLVYAKYKSGLPPVKEAHPDAETTACFLENRLSTEENRLVKEHLLQCAECGQVFAHQLKLGANAQADSAIVPVLEIILKLKDKFMELLSTTGDVLVGSELMPAPVLRSRKISDFRDEVTILKDFDNIRVEIKIENKNSAIFNACVLVKEKESSAVIRDLRVTLIKDSLELESYTNDLGRVTFEGVSLGKYNIEISRSDKKLVSILLDARN